MTIATAANGDKMLIMMKIMRMTLMTTTVVRQSNDQHRKAQQLLTQLNSVDQKKLGTHTLIRKRSKQTNYTSQLTHRTLQSYCMWWTQTFHPLPWNFSSWTLLGFFFQSIPPPPSPLLFCLPLVFVPIVFLPLATSSICFHNPPKTITTTLSQNVTTCMQAKQSNMPTYNQFCEPQLGLKKIWW